MPGVEIMLLGDKDIWYFRINLIRISLIYMRKLYFLNVILALLVLFFTKNISAQFGAARYEYIIENFESNIVINQDTTLTVTEKIEAVFNVPKHGIFRIIPTYYTANGRSINSKLNILSVTDDKNLKIPYEVSRLKQSVQIKIGDPDRTIRGSAVYLIKYKVSNVLQRFETHDELYWNVTGTEWDTVINKASALVESPNAKVINIDCFGCKNSFTQNTASFNVIEPLSLKGGLTVVVGLDKNNTLLFPSPFESTVAAVFDNWGYLLSPAPLLLLFVVWYKKGRDKKYLEGSIYYKPEKEEEIDVGIFKREHLPLVYHPIDGLTPSQVGTIIDEKIDIHDVVAEIVELARLGFIKIVRLEEKGFLHKKADFEFIKLSRDRAPLREYQKYLLDEIFRSNLVLKSIPIAEKKFKDLPDKLKAAQKGLIEKEYVLMSALKDNFYTSLESFKKKVYESLVEQGVFDRNPETVRAFWYGVSIVLNILAFMALLFFSEISGNIIPIIFLVLTIPIALLLARSIPRRTAWGYSLFRQITGLRYFLDIGRWRHEIHEKHLFLEEVFPLAISLGVVTKLASDMKDLSIAPPSYFESVGLVNFYVWYAGFESSFSNTLVSSPGGKWSGSGSWSGGSGFGGGGGGGGFGGGGGGSW